MVTEKRKNVAYIYTKSNEYSQKERETGSVFLQPNKIRSMPSKRSADHGGAGAAIPVTMMIFTTESDVSALCRAATVGAVHHAEANLSAAPATYTDSSAGLSKRGSTVPANAKAARGSDQTAYDYIPLPRDSTAVATAAASAPSTAPLTSLFEHAEGSRLSAAFSSLRLLQESLMQRSTLALPSDAAVATEKESTQKHARTAADEMRSSDVGPTSKPLFFHAGVTGAAAAATSTGNTDVSFLWARNTASDEDEGFSIGAANSPPVSLLCVDVGGLYTAAPASLPLSLPPRPLCPAGAKKSHAHFSSQPNVLSDGVAAVPEGLLTQSSLEVLLRFRFSHAQSSFPLAGAAANGTPTLAEVWVVPLPRSTPANASALNGSPLDYFPAFVVLPDREQDGNGRAAKQQHSPSLQAASLCVRLRQQAADLKLHLPLSAGRRKRGRESEEEGEESEGSVDVGGEEAVVDGGAAANHNAANLRAKEAVLQLNASGSTSLRLRVMASAFLTHSCYFSTWCCADDFDVTRRFLHRSSTVSANGGGGSGCKADERSVTPRLTRHGGTFHAFYAALRHSAEAEEAAVRAAWTAVWCTDGALTTCGACARGACSPGFTPAADTAQKCATDDLFKDAVTLQAPLPDAEGSSDAAWSVQTLWDLWVRLGWTPPCLPSPFHVRLHDGVSMDRTTHCRQGESSCWLTSAEWMTLVARCSSALDDAYVQQTLVRLDGDEGEVADVSAAGESAGEGSEHCDNASPCTLPQSRRTHDSSQIAEMKGECLKLLRRSFAMRAALLTQDADKSVISIRRALRVEENKDEAPPVQDGGNNLEGHRGTGASYDDVSYGPLMYVSPAAQALAADIAATTTPVSSFADAAARFSTDFAGASMPVGFSQTWAEGVLESPTLTFLFPQAEAADRGGVEGIPPYVLQHEFLHRPRGGAMNMGASSPLSEAGAAAPSVKLMASEEAFCEVSDISELYWRLPAGVLRTRARPERPHCTKARDSQHNSNHNKDAEQACSCCCALACQASAKAALVVAASEAEAEVKQTDRKLGDPTAEWLRTAFLSFLARNGAHVASATRNAAGGDASSLSSAVAHRSGVTDPAMEAGGGEELSTATPDLPAGAALSAVFADTVVSVVQQNKAVVRRLMQLVQSYQSIAGTAVPASSAVSGAASCDGLAARVWRCLCGTEGSSAETAEEGDLATSAKRLAIRQLQRFWNDVATVARESVRKKYHAVLVARLDAGRPDEVICGGGTPISHNEEEGDAGRGNGRVSIVAEMGKQLAVTDQQQRQQQCQAQKAAAFEEAVDKLDGTGAMQLYMQRLLTCSVDRGAAPPSVPQSESPDMVSADVHPPLSTAAGAAKAVWKPSVASPFTELLQPHLWLQHALFILSYGLAGLSEDTAALTVDERRASSLHEGRDEGRTTQHSYVPSTSSDNIAVGGSFRVSPRLAAFRVLRGGKLALDSWIVMALEEYASRWQRAVDRQASA